MNRDKGEVVKRLKAVRSELTARESRMDGIFIRGAWEIKCFEHGKLLWIKSGHNLVVTAGLNHLADQLADTPAQADMGWMAAGTSNQAPAAGDTALIGTELGRVALTSRTQSTNTIAYLATFPAGTATGTWEEVAILNAASNGTMLDRLLTGTLVKASTYEFQETITLTISAV